MTIDTKNDDIDSEKLSEETNPAVLPEKKLSFDNNIYSLNNKVSSRYRVNFEDNILAFSMETADAYSVVDEQSSSSFLALVCKPDTLFRTRPIRILHQNNILGLVYVQAHGLVMDPNKLQPRYAIIVEFPQGGQLVRPNENFINKFTQKEVLEVIMPMLLSGLESLVNSNLVHRSIHLSNIWCKEKGKGSVILGECFINSPGFNLPIVYEPIDRMMASKIGRGVGSHLDDIYAFGVTIIGLLIGKDPALGRKDETIIVHKIILGTFMTLVGEERFSYSVSHFLRGCVVDSTEDRWNIHYIRAWQDGKVFRTRRFMPDKKANTPIHFLGKDYFYKRLLAFSMFDKQESAILFIREEKIEYWLKRNLSDAQSAQEISLSVGFSEADNLGDSGHLLLAQVILVLDPYSPLRYRSLSFCSDGIGSVIGDAYLTKNYSKINQIRAVINKGLLTYMSKVRSIFLSSNSNDNLYERMQSHVIDNKLYTGMERLLYDFNQSVPCLSPSITQYYCFTIKSLLLAMNEEAKRNPNAIFMEKHIFTFICSHSSKVEELYRIWLSSKEDNAETKKMSYLILIALAQKELYRRPLPDLALWFVNSMDVALSVYYSHIRRTKMIERLQNVAKKGELSQILDIATDKSSINQDHLEYDDAVNKFLRIDNEINNLKIDNKTRKKLAIRIGYKVSSVLAYFLLCLSVFYVLFVKQ